MNDKMRRTHRVYRLATLRSIIAIVLLLWGASFSLEVKAQSLEGIVQSYSNKGTKIGVMVHDVKSKKALFENLGHKGMNPASTMKVVTSTAALNYLGGPYQYKTPLTTDKLSGGVAHNLYIKGKGDPSLVEERLWRIAKDLKVRGVKKIQGDIVIDNGFFDGFNFAGKDSSSSRAYNASLSALAVNFNSFAVVAKNFGASGGLQVHVDPPTDYFVLKSRIGGSGNSIAVSRTAKGGKEYVQASGGVSGEKVKYANVADPVQYAGSTLKWVLEQNGIEVTGKIRAGNASGGKRLFQDKSKPLSLILRDLNKFSNNFTAEMVVKTLGAIKGGVPGSTAKGVKILNGYLAKIGVSSTEYNVFNGSGLSRKNRISPNALNQTLLSAYANNKIRSDFIATLAIAGTDGTLRRRLKSAILKGNVKAKTGTLNDVAALSGFIETKKKNILVFTILVNGPGAGAGGFFAMQEKLLNAMYNKF